MYIIINTRKIILKAIQKGETCRTLQIMLQSRRTHALELSVLSEAVTYIMYMSTYVYSPSIGLPIASVVEVVFGRSFRATVGTTNAKALCRTAREEMMVSVLIFMVY